MAAAKCYLPLMQRNTLIWHDQLKYPRLIWREPSEVSSFNPSETKFTAGPEYSPLCSHMKCLEISILNKYCVHVLIVETLYIVKVLYKAIAKYLLETKFG